MIISSNTKISEQKFISLLEATCLYLKKIAKEDEGYFLSRGGIDFEEDVLDAMILHAEGTDFEGSIKRISGQKFPDIIACDYYGVEVKTSKGKDWKTTGNSVLEGTRVDGIEKIFLLFGKLSKPIGFKCRKYEDCLYEVAVTHSPRYLIDMNLSKKDSIFNKLNISYNDLRVQKNPIKPIVDYYKSKLKEGDELWWIGGDKTSNFVLIQWTNLSEEEKRDKIIEAFCLFPELFSSSSKKYLRLSSWLVSKYGIVSPSLRDSFSAGGQEEVNLSDETIKFPKVYGHLLDNLEDIKTLIKSKDATELSQYWREEVLDNKVGLWTNLITRNSKLDQNKKKYLLEIIKNKTSVL